MRRGLVTPWRLLAVLVVLAGLPAIGTAQPADESDLAEAVRARYEVTPIVGGVALLPRDRELGISMIEIRGGTAIVDGEPEPATAQQLATRLGAEAAPLLRLMYLDTATQRVTLGLPPLGATESATAGLDATGESIPAQAADAETGAEDERAAPRERRVTRRDVVRFGGHVHIDVDERVRGDVVVIGGSLVVDGEVRGDITVVGGSATFGPEAVAAREVTVVGGSLTRAPGARFSRGVNEVSFDAIDFDFSDLRIGLPTVRIPRPDVQLFRSLDLVGTLIRLGFFGLLGSVVLLLAAGSTERVARRVAREPVKSGVVGFLAQLLFLPLLLIGIVLLVITIIGIPLLVLVPVVLLAAGIVMVLGFTGVAQGVGRLLAGGAGGRSALVLFWIGLVLLMLPTLFGETLSLIGGPVGVIAVMLAVTGFAVEYLAWTTGVGAVILNRFGTELPEAPSPTPDAPPPPPPVAPEPDADLPLTPSPSETD